MTTEFIWQLPTGGDGRYGEASPSRRGERSAQGRAPFTAGVSDPRGAAFNYFDYLHQVARAADLAGFDGLQIRQTADGDDAWIVAGYVARGTRHLTLLTEFDAAWGSPVYAAKNTVSFQRASNGRFAWQLGAGLDAATRARHGDPVPDAEVLARIEEFVTVARGVQSEAPYSYRGRYFEVLNGGFRGPLAGNRLPPIYLSGVTDDAWRLSARVADVHILDAAPLAQLRPAIERLRALAGEQGRTLRIALRTALVAREDETEARRDAKHAAGDADALTGSYADIEQQLFDYAQAGIDSFILSATPALEEAYRIGEHLLPALRARLAQAALQAA